MRPLGVDVPMAKMEHGAKHTPGSPSLRRRDVVLGGAALAVARGARGQSADPILLRVDATDVARGILRVEQDIPLSRPGPLTLLFAQWVPGTHGPTGAVNDLAGLDVSADGRRLAWRRDDENMFAFHVGTPAGANALALRFHYLSPRRGTEGRITVSRNLLMLAWNTVLLYPAGVPVQELVFRPGLTLPADWEYATALDPVRRDGATTEFRPVSLERLVDSPVLAGRHFRRKPLTEGPDAVVLNIAAERPEHLPDKQEHIDAHRRLVGQADLLFGTRHFRRYEFLLALSDQLGPSGLEHHESSENVTSASYFKEWDDTAPRRQLLPHEFAHSWNGKYRRPEGHRRQDFNTALNDRMLWVYEGLTQYWGWVLAARSGLWDAATARDTIAYEAAVAEHRAGRRWRPLQDTTLAPVIRYRRGEPWLNWQRGEDYYNEGALIWLEVDTLLRARTGGAQSLDAFARDFFGGGNHELGPVYYTLEDIAGALDAISSMEWRGFFEERLDQTGEKAPLAGLTQGGYRLEYTDKPGAHARARERLSRLTDLYFSLGVLLNAQGEVQAARWESPAYDADITRGVQIVGVNGQAYSAETLRAAVAAKAPLTLWLKDGDELGTRQIGYQGGLRHPVLQRGEGHERSLDAILAAR